MKMFAPHMVDGYKQGHRSFYQKGTDFLYSNLTPRSDKYFKGGRLYDGKMVVFGAQGAIQEIVEMWDSSFFSQPKEKVIARYKRRVDSYLGEGSIPVDGMAALHDLGYLPLEIKTIDEGSRIKMKIPMLTIKNTVPEFFWLVNYLETVLSDMIWKGTTNATIAYEYKRILTDYAVRTGSLLDFVQFQCHDFSMRGMSGPEDSCRSSAGHLTSFTGTDAMGAMDYVEDYYGLDVDFDNYLLGCSIPATEHAVSSSNILNRLEAANGDLLEAEKAFLKDYITRTLPTGMAGYVSDTFDYWALISEVLPSLKDVIMARDGKLVIRPDSGDPVDIICGTAGGEVYATLEEARAEVNDQHYDEAAEACEGSHCMGNDEYETIVYVKEESKYYSLKTRFEYNRHDKQYYYIDNYGGAGITVPAEVAPSPEMKGTVQMLWEIFGGTTNDAGFKELDSHIGIIYGDSITLERAEKILNKLEAAGFAANNVVFGVGSYTYQSSTRDTFGTAMKATASGVDGDVFEIYKDPATGDKLKKSARGFLKVDYDEAGELVLKDQVTAEEEKTGLLKVRFKDGKFFNLEGIDVIRQRLA